MVFRKLGKTNIDVSVLGLGCAGLGGVFGEMAETDAIQTVRAAFDEGINYLDTAPLYGYTRSETVVGKALKGVPRDWYYVSSKVGRYDFKDSDFSYERVKSGLNASLERLGCGYLDIAILHDIEFVPMEDVLGGGLRALLEAKAEGKIRFIGASGLPLKIFPAILAETDLDVVITYNHYTLQDTSALEMVPLFEKHELGVINASPVAQGLLTPQGPQKWHFASAQMKARCKEAAAWCAAQGFSIAELAMQFAMANESFHSTLSGACTAAEARQNARAAVTPPDLEAVAEVQKILAPVMNETWRSGRDEYN